MQDRYYVQRTGDDYLVRELQQPGDVPSPNDVIIRSFSAHGQEDAHAYARLVNDLQRTLDVSNGHWVKHAVLPAADRTPSN
jgi:hypothetical protein